MHPLRKLRESGNPTAARVGELLAENIVFNSPILVRPITGREVIAAIFAQSSATRGSGTYTAEFKLDERTTFLRWVGTMDARTSTLPEEDDVHPHANPTPCRDRPSPRPCHPVPRVGSA